MTETGISTILHTLHLHNDTSLAGVTVCCEKLRVQGWVELARSSVRAIATPRIGAPTRLPLSEQTSQPQVAPNLLFNFLSP